MTVYNTPLGDVEVPDYVQQPHSKGAAQKLRKRAEELRFAATRLEEELDRARAALISRVEERDANTQEDDRLAEIGRTFNKNRRR